MACYSASVRAVGAPVVGQVADFDLPRGEDTLQTGPLGRLPHVLQDPVQQLLICASEVCLVPLKYLAETDLALLRIHHTAIIVLQEGLGRRAQLTIDVLIGQRGQIM